MEASGLTMEKAPDWSRRETLSKQQELHHEAPTGQAARVPLLSILLYTTLMALASGLGAVPFLIFGRLKV